MVAAPRPPNNREAEGQLREAQIKLRGVIFAVTGVQEFLDAQVAEILKTMTNVGISPEHINDVAAPAAAAGLGLRTLVLTLEANAEILSVLAEEVSALSGNDS